jgi:hypothetical protein
MRPSMCSKVILSVILSAVSTHHRPVYGQENWVLVGKNEAITVLIDIASFLRLPNGVTTFKERIRANNPITGQPMNLDRARGIDCKSKEIVYLADGKREAYGNEKIKSVISDCPGKNCTSYAIAFTNFCPLGE